MINIRDLLYEITENELVYKEDINLLESGLLDSYTFIELFTRLEDEGIILQPTRIDRKKLETIQGIEELIEDAKNI